MDTSYVCKEARPLVEHIACTCSLYIELQHLGMADQASQQENAGLRCCKRLRREGAHALPMKSRELATAPARRSEWPLRNLVALWTTTKPMSAGRQSMGLAKVLSMTGVRPCCPAKRATPARSVTRTSGLEMLST